MGVAYVAYQVVLGAPHWQVPSSRYPLVFQRGQNALVRANCASVGASLPSGRAVPASDRPQQQRVRLGASNGNSAGSGGGDVRTSNGVVTSAAVVTSVPSTQQDSSSIVVTAVRPSPKRQQTEPAFAPVPEDVIAEFEHKLEADLQTVGVTLLAILGVIIFWRGVWALLDHFVGDSVVGDICCIIVGLTIVLYIRLSGMKIASFWPPS
ncbi:hypothetical protein VOLCADRAFT_104975 [Volvox carteri f. nagariensis]|uniref:Uncharacterized protein n=1 Tax=Volvox carteri f. nagariensis TaxID=3068 RepID=D8TXJ8_VOLCA|nr:uncharacterized protein VOLCADRAFT_104975 [Volvox carteri f. nagariensis]EFJ47654.1 hypothetical protein VOLCADRAFT_104975 [Volvox carteri f. nagariensis]|eukprot:XP_002951125.1 hypothetical protein VOLCADRAFT_104975 [Volvox carteri f. nagariensis]